MVVRPDWHITPSVVESSAASATAVMIAATESLESHLELILGERVGTINPDQRQLLDSATRHVRRLLRIVADLQTIALVRDGDLELEWGYCDLAAVVRRAVEAVRPIAHVDRKAIVIDEPPSIRTLADASLLERALVALADYAVASAPGGSEITIRVRPLEVELSFEADVAPRDAVPALALARAVGQAHESDLTAAHDAGVTTLTLALGAVCDPGREQLDRE